MQYPEKAPDATVELPQYPRYAQTKCTYQMIRMDHIELLLNNHGCNFKKISENILKYYRLVPFRDSLIDKAAKHLGNEPKPYKGTALFLEALSNKDGSKKRFIEQLHKRGHSELADWAEFKIII